MSWAELAAGVGSILFLVGFIVAAFWRLWSK